MLAGRPDPPVSGTAARHCAVTHLSVPLSVSGRQRARGARRPRVPRSGRCRVPHTGRGQTPRRRPEPRGTSTAGPPLSLSFSLSVAPPTDRFQTAPETSSAPLSPTPLLPPSRVPHFSPPLPAPRPPASDHRKPLPRSDSGRAPPPSTIPR
jgi:hypothetical protein